MTFPILPSNAVGGYQVQRSLRFNSADSAYLNRTPSVAGNRMTWTWSGWFKRSSIGGSNAMLFNCSVSTDTGAFIYFSAAANSLYFSNSSGSTLLVGSSAAYRDASAWYHVVVALDTTQATTSNRVKLYINGVQITSFLSTTYPALNFQFDVNSTNNHNIGTNTGVLDGYLTEVNFIDGQALTPSSFGETNATTGQWQPKRYTGTYGTNGFYLNFSDNSGTTATTLGRDFSGNGNNWTPNNFSVTPGAGNDSMIDVPTNWDDGGNGRGNYCTLNPLDNAGQVLANGNLDSRRATTSWSNSGCRASFGVTSGKWYWEITQTSATSGSANNHMGVSKQAASLNNYLGSDGSGWAYEGASGLKYTSGGGSSYGATWTTNDVIGVAFDADAGTLTFYKNGASQGQAFSGLTSGPYFPTVSLYGTISCVANFGQRPFAYTPPSGFKALNTQNIAAGTITTSGTFTGNVNADGPFVWLNGVPTAMTINGNAVTFGTHADKLSNGFKVRSSSTSYNNTGSNTYSITTTGARFKVANAQGNP